MQYSLCFTFALHASAAMADPADASAVVIDTDNADLERLVDGADDFDAGERTYQDEQSWTLLEEDEQGRLRTTDAAAHLRPRRRVKAGLAQRIRRGMIRYVQLVIDMSRAAAVTDWRPNRLVVMAGMVEEFITHFFDENPLSQMGIIALRDGIAVRLSDLSSTPELHKAALRKGLDAGGDVSLQNGLDMAVEDLNAVPPYGSREVLFLFAALSTCDPGNILTSITAAKNAKCRVSIVGLAAEVYVCKHMAKETGGGYAVALNEHHLLELLHTHAAPPPWADATMAASLVHMGFPQRNAEGAVTFIGADCTLSSGGFTCPRCLARLPTLPCSCFVCGLTCVLSPHIARSYHHLFPLPVFEEVYHLQEEGKGHAEGVQAHAPPTPPPITDPFLTHTCTTPHTLPAHCFGCFADLTGVRHGGPMGGPPLVPALGVDGVEGASRCPDCKHVFCYECDVLLHEVVHNCPGCECIPPTATEA